MADISYKPLNTARREIRLLVISQRWPKSSTSASIRGGKPQSVAEHTTRMADSLPEEPWDKAVAQLINMGFSAEHSREALLESGSSNLDNGFDMDKAIDWIFANRKQRDSPESKSASLSARPKESSRSILNQPHPLAEGSEAKEPDLMVQLNSRMKEMWKKMDDQMEELERALEGNFISCTLQTVSLLANPTFSALSYTWGDPKIRKSITIDGKSVQITQNLWDALYHIRKDNEEVTMWVDALCINQTDFEEKNSQVPLMKDIYETATGVLVWVGLASDNSDVLMKRLDEVGKDAFQAGILKVHGTEATKVLRPQDRGEVLSWRLLRIRKSLEEMSDKPSFDFPWAASGPFSMRPYWTRVWIIQEVTVARQVDIICGTMKVPFHHFAAATIFLGFHSVRTGIKAATRSFTDPTKAAKLNQMVFISSHGHLVGSRRRFQQEAGPGDDLLGLLKKTCLDNDFPLARRVTDPRDIIYGILGMATDVNSIGIKPDYRKSNTIQDVFTKTTRALLKQGHMIILAWCGRLLKSPGLTGLPSWVPDFTSPILSPCCEDKNYPLFSASGNGVNIPRQTIFDSPKGPKFLALKAHKVAKILMASQPWHGEDFDFESCYNYLNIISSYCELAKCSPSKSGSPVSLINWEEAPWRIPSADQAYDGTRKRATAALEKDYKELKYILENMNSLQGLEAVSNISDSCNFYRLAIAKQHARKVFMSSDGYVGLVPATARMWDDIVVIPGANMPFVLRKNLWQDTYTLVGEAYVHGIMDGELVGQLPVQETFHIC